MNYSMKRIHRVIRSSALAGLALTCFTMSGCATQAPSAEGDMHKAIIDFNSCAKPEYPQADLQAGHQGTVTLSFLVSPEGTAADSRVLRSSGFPSMDEAARSAIAKCRFTPATVNGKPVQQWTQIQYVWTLK